MSDFDLKMEGMDEFRRRMLAAPEIVSEEMARGIDRITLAGRAASQKLAPKDTGHLRRSITQTKATRMGGDVRGSWGTNVPYAAAMEEGRGAGKKMPPAGALLGWMQRHGIAASEYQESTTGLGNEFRVRGKSAYQSVEFLIARAIGKHGIKGKWYMRTARQQLAPKVVPEFRLVVKRIIARMGG